MIQYIDKSAVVAEMERRIKEILFNHTENALVSKKVYKEILSFINTLEVKDEVVSTDPTSPNSLKISRHGNSHTGAMTETLRKKEIDEAANEYINGEPDGAQKVVSKVGFLFGAEWADEHPRVHHQLPVGNVWHDSNIEQPQLGSDIVVLQGKNGEVLNSTISVEPDRLWAYINDLLDLTKREEAMKEALRMEYEKGRADAIAEMQKEQTKEYLEGVKRVQNYKELTKFEKGFDRIAETYAHRKNKDGYNKPWYTKERAAEMLYWAKEELGIFNEQ